MAAPILSALLPSTYYREYADLKSFLDALQPVIDELYDDIVAWVNIFDIDVCEEKWLNVILRQLGWWLPVQYVTLEFKRKLAHLVIDIYKSKGTKIGVINTVRTLLGYEISIEEINVGAWMLSVTGRSELSRTTWLGASEGAGVYHFNVYIGQNLTAIELANLEMVIDYMKPAHTHYRVVEPPLPINHWCLDYSRLGTETYLHEDTSPPMGVVIVR